MKKLYFIINENTNQVVTSPYTTQSRLLAGKPLEAGKKVILTTEKNGGFWQLWGARDGVTFNAGCRMELLRKKYAPRKDTITVAEELCLKFIEAGIIKDTEPEIFEYKFGKLVAKKSVFDICKVIEEYFGVPSITCEDYDDIMNLYIKTI